MAFCPNCGAQHPDDAEFCPSCGKPVGGSAQAAANKHYGGFWIRVAAYLIDFFVLLIPNLIIARVFRHQRAVADLLVLALDCSYFAVFESSARQATLGKQAMGLKVTDDQGDRISLGRAVGRYFAKLLAFIIFFIGVIMVGFTDRKRGLHDMIAGTLVERR